MRTCLVLLALLVPVLLGAGTNPVKQDDPKAKVKQAVNQGVNYLKTTQRDGNWEHMSTGLSLQYRGGTTCLALLALLESGAKVDDPAIKSGLEYVRKLPPEKTYVVALQTAVLAKANLPGDKEMLQRNTDWLVKNANTAHGKIKGWSYPVMPVSDNSNTHYAVLGLHAAAQAGAKIDPDVWQQIGDYYLQDRLPNHGWSYKDRNPMGERTTMVSAGITGLAIVQKHLKGFDAKKAVEESWARLGEIHRATPNANPRNVIYFRFYNMYALCRAGELTGRTTLKDAGGVEIMWYRLGMYELLKSQELNGSWRATDTHDGNPILATSFSLLYLANAEKLLK